MAPERGGQPLGLFITNGGLVAIGIDDAEKTKTSQAAASMPARARRQPQNRAARPQGFNDGVKAATSAFAKQAGRCDPDATTEIRRHGQRHNHQDRLAAALGARLLQWTREKEVQASAYLSRGQGPGTPLPHRRGRIRQTLSTRIFISRTRGMAMKISDSIRERPLKADEEEIEQAIASLGDLDHAALKERWRALRGGDPLTTESPIASPSAGTRNAGKGVWRLESKFCGSAYAVSARSCGPQDAFQVSGPSLRSSRAHGSFVNGKATPTRWQSSSTASNGTARPIAASRPSREPSPARGGMVMCSSA